jgi:hypothetical protein
MFLVPPYCKQTTAQYNIQPGRGAISAANQGNPRYGFFESMGDRAICANYVRDLAKLYHTFTFATETVLGLC